MRPAHKSEIVKINRVVTAIDDNYLLPLIVMAFSAKKNCDSAFEIVVGYDPEKLSVASRETISKCFAILEIPLQLKSFTLKADFRDNNHITATTFVRFLMFDSFDGSVLWLDVDLICLPKWDQVFTEFAPDMQSTLIFGAREYLAVPGEKTASPNNLAMQAMGKDYFNAGVLLINCDLWKTNNIPNTWPYLLSNYDRLGFQFSDQCIINYSCVNHYKNLPSKYNALAPNQVRYRTDDPRILHFAGGFKPWQFTRVSPRVFFSGLVRSDIYKYLDIQKEAIAYLKASDEKTSSILLRIANDFAKKKSFYTFMKGVILIKIMRANRGEQFINFVMRLKKIGY